LKHKNILEEIKTGNISKEVETTLNAVAKEVTERFK